MVPRNYHRQIVRGSWNILFFSDIKMSCFWDQHSCNNVKYSIIANYHMPYNPPSTVRKPVSTFLFTSLYMKGGGEGCNHQVCFPSFWETLGCWSNQTSQYLFRSTFENNYRLQWLYQVHEVPSNIVSSSVSFVYIDAPLIWDNHTELYTN